MNRTKLAYRVDLSEASECDTEGCNRKAAFVDVYVLDNGGLLHAFSCAECKPLSEESVVDEEDPIPN